MNPSRSKPPTCRYFLAGTCSRGSSCPFSHDAAEGIGQGSGSSQPTTGERKVCKFFLRGGEFHCSFGDRCKYLHIRPDHDVGSSSRYEAPAGVPKPEIEVDLPADPFETNGLADALDSAVEVSVCTAYYSSGHCTNEHCPLRHDFKQCKICENYALHPTDDDVARQHVEECTARHNRIEMRAQSQHIECGICLERIIESNRKFGLLYVRFLAVIH